ncbi:MAG TPA: DUF1810 domain-containing protein [Gemmatimonadaceae bacterium]|nr:DUF1810 domain-containing protein [Gemmatimonadaceae bacterium]
MTPSSGDPFNLQRFVDAQASNYAEALAELNAGRKETHWMWYVFPQIAGLGGGGGFATLYAIGSKDEARAYLRHPVLGARLLECCIATLKHHRTPAIDIFGSIDAMKLRSCATLFAQVSPPGSVFEQIIERFYDGAPDRKTLDLLQRLKF